MKYLGCVNQVCLLLPLFFLIFSKFAVGQEKEIGADTLKINTAYIENIMPVAGSVDTVLFNSLQVHLAHNKLTNKWPVKAAYPRAGAILPFKRIVAYYGNFYSKGMGVLGKLPENRLLEKLATEVTKWEKADTLIPVLPAIHYIAVTAQANPGKDKMYRLRMPSSQIDKALGMAKSIDCILFLDIQVGHSNLQSELPALERYLSLPNVHLGIDPEYSMKGSDIPCAVIGTIDAADINYATELLSLLVKNNNLPPKILVIHRFTIGMLTNYKNIIIRPEVQLVIDMDGFGFAAKKIDSYKNVVSREPVQFTGFKLFYVNDKLAPRGGLMEPHEILKLSPSPVYIQYQ